MAAEWASKQRENISYLYKCMLEHIGNTTEQQVEGPGSLPWQLVQVFQDLLEGTSGPRTAAERLASVLLEYPDIEYGWGGHTWACLFSAIDHFGDETELKRLADMLAELANLPDAVYERKARDGAGNDTANPNKHRKVVHWPDMYEFSMNMREHFNGPEAYIYPHGRDLGHTVATQLWRNMNTFCALCTHYYGDTGNPLSHYLKYGLWALANALEHSRVSEIGRNIALHLPSATQWICIAGQELFDATNRGLTALSGDVWYGGRRPPGVYPYDRERWNFWQYRFERLAESGTFGSEMRIGLITAADRMAKISASSDHPNRPIEQTEH